MSIVPFSGGKTVLITTDDALSVYVSISGRTRPVENLSWDDESFKEKLHRCLIGICKKRPIIVLNDMVEQHYRKERVRKAGVGLMDRSSMIDRKLMVAFPNYPIRAALSLKEKTRQAGNTSYIFTAIPETQKIKDLLSVIHRPEFVVEGFCLLPVEATDMIKNISDRLLKRQKKKAAWTIFMGQHKSGSLRQVVIKDGELALTRMTPIADMHETPENWVLEAHQEFKATMSYLARFGYEESDGLSVVVIADNEIGRDLEKLITEECVYNSLSMAQVSSVLGIKQVAASGENYTDLLHASWVAKKKQVLLPMSVAILDRVAKPRRYAKYASLLLFLLCGYLIQQSYAGFSKLDVIASDFKGTTLFKKRLDAEYEAEVTEKAKLGYDVDLMQGALEVHKSLQESRPDVLAIFKEIGVALDGNMRLNKIEISQPQSKVASMIEQLQIIPGQEVERTLYKGVLTIIYPTTTNIDEGNAQVKEFHGRLQARLKDHDVVVSKFLNDYEYTDQVVIDSSVNQRDASEQDFTVEITIEKRVKDAE